MIGTLLHRLFGAASPALPDGRPGTALLRALGSGDYGSLRSASATIALTRDTVLLDDLVALLAHVEAARATYGNDPQGIGERYELDFVLRKLRLWRDQAGCACELYPYWMYYRPEREIAAGHLLPLANGTVDDARGDTQDAACTVCGSHWRCIEREYHAPWWEWSALPR